MSVDTYLKRKNTSKYQTADHDGVRVMVSPLLARQARSITVELKRVWFWQAFSIGIEPVGEHFHGPACRH